MTHLNGYSRALAAVLCAALMSACSAGGSGGSNGLTASHGILPAAHHFQTGTIKARFHIPAPKKHGHPAAARLAKGRHAPHWLPASATEIDFTLLAVNGDSDNVGGCNVGQGSNCFNFTIYTTGSSAGGCTSDGNGGLTCNIAEPAPAATDTYQIAAQYCSGHTNADGSCGAPSGLGLLSQASASINVPLNGTANGNFTLDPVVAALQWNASNIGVGSGQPFATGTLPGHPLVQIQAVDQYGDVIVGSTTSPGGSYNTALYLQPDGSVDNISWNCTDPSVQFETGGGPFSDLGGFAPLSQEVLANGFNAGGSYDAKHHVKAGARYPFHDEDDGGSFNSPEANPMLDYDGGSWGMGTDGNGNQVQGVGNNGTEINYDGSDALDLSTEFDCNAYDDEGNQATIAVTLGNGTVTWGANAKRRMHR